MAIDEAILKARIQGKVPNTLRLFRWHPSAVSIGRFQNIYDEVNLQQCRVHSVDVIRRISGGGSVYHDSEDEITYSVVVKQDDLGTNDVAEAYGYICRGLIETARILGVNAEYNQGHSKQCPNIVVGGRKISGSAQAIKKGVVLQHGTFLVRANLDKMFRYLRGPQDACADLVKLARTKITSVTDELGIDTSAAMVYETLNAGFEKGLGVDLVKKDITHYELDLARKLEKEKYLTTRWNFDGD